MTQKHNRCGLPDVYGYTDDGSRQLTLHLMSALNSKGVRDICLNPLVGSREHEDIEHELPSYMEEEGALDELIDALEASASDKKTHYALALLRFGR